MAYILELRETKPRMDSPAPMSNQQKVCWVGLVNPGLVTAAQGTYQLGNACLSPQDVDDRIAQFKSDLNEIATRALKFFAP
jgi:hypothetical protein